MGKAEDLVFGGLEARIHDGALSLEARESARGFRDRLSAVYEKRAAMRDCPALCLMEIRRAAAAGSRALELALRYTGRRFWDKPAFCREALRITGEAEERVKILHREDL